MSEQFDTLVLSTYADLCVLWRMEVVSCRSNAKDINTKLLSLESVIESFGLGLPGLSQQQQDVAPGEKEEISNAQAISKAQAFGDAQALASADDSSGANENQEPAITAVDELAARARKPTPRPAIAEADPNLEEAELVARPARAEFAKI